MERVAASLEQDGRDQQDLLGQVAMEGAVVEQVDFGVVDLVAAEEQVGLMADEEQVDLVAVEEVHLEDQLGVVIIIIVIVWIGNHIIIVGIGRIWSYRTFHFTKIKIHLP